MQFGQADKKSLCITRLKLINNNKVIPLAGNGITAAAQNPNLSQIYSTLLRSNENRHTCTIICNHSKSSGNIHKGKHTHTHTDNLNELGVKQLRLANVPGCSGTGFCTSTASISLHELRCLTLSIHHFLFSRSISLPHGWTNEIPFFFQPT